ncbi:uncharacterized protein LOC111915250 [Lactuca sativa]|uniref:uncharacterized protein LOC111915250 n=1 Tax=Lactuca sativa TaxID=4236 RepID=UPI000CD9BB5B|nr:uncharacterized protein LOC111915250 [Lactuca sativa]
MSSSSSFEEFQVIFNVAIACAQMAEQTYDVLCNKAAESSQRRARRYIFRNREEANQRLALENVQRWESRIESVKTIITQAPEIVKALRKLVEEETDIKIISEATCLGEYELGRFDFITGMVIWYHILAKVNNLSKQLQSETMRIDETMSNVGALVEFFKDYRENGFGKALDCARAIASDLEIYPVFVEKNNKRKVVRKRHFDENDIRSSEPVHELSPQESFRIQYFVYIIDQAIGSLERMFEQYKQYEDISGFLFTTEKLKSMNTIELKSCCKNLEKRLQNGHISDINVDDLFNKMELLQKHLPAEHNTANGILNFLKMMNTYPISCLAYRILLTVPITVASSEKSFSKLYLLKFYLRSTMSQERLNVLALISIENEFLDYESLIVDFSSKNARSFTVLVDY